MTRAIRCAALLLAVLLCACAAQPAVTAPAAGSEAADSGAAEPQPQPGLPDEPEQPEQSDSLALPNPIAPVGSSGEFAALGFEVEAPEGSDSVSYSIIAKTTAQADFIFGGKRYSHRASKGMQWQMLSGVYESFEEETGAVPLEEGEAVLLTVEGKGSRLAYWKQGEISYTLYTADAASDSELAALIKLLDKGYRD